MADRPLWYILDDDNRPVPVADLSAMALWAMHRWGDQPWSVARDEIGPLLVSTIFLGMDHRHLGKGPPLLFETVIVSNEGVEGVEMQRRTATWIEAEAEHAIAVAKARAMIAGADAMLEGARDG